MILLGVLLVVAAVVLIVFGVAVAAVKWLLWVGIALLVIGGVVVLIHAVQGRRNRAL